jgi:negative regulator of flagellin synthesis FlgM
VKIGKSGPTGPVDNQGAGDTRVRPGQAAATPETAAAGEKVEISSLSATLQQAEAAMAEVPIVDQQRVDEIKQAMSDGNFKVDAEKVADGLIESAREALDAQSHKT